MGGRVLKYLCKPTNAVLAQRRRPKGGHNLEPVAHNVIGFRSTAAQWASVAFSCSDRQVVLMVFCSLQGMVLTTDDVAPVVCSLSRRSV